MNDAERYRVALLDWLACAVAGSTEPAAQAAFAAGDSLLERVTAQAAIRDLSVEEPVIDDIVRAIYGRTERGEFRE